MMKMQLDHHAWMLMPPTAILSVLTFTAYFAYRIYCLVKAQETIQPSNALGLAWFFLAIEFLIFGVYLVCNDTGSLQQPLMRATL